jgi:hypothetical protein
MESKFYPVSFIVLSQTINIHREALNKWKCTLPNWNNEPWVLGTCFSTLNDKKVQMRKE